MQLKNFVRPAIASLVLLIIPLIGVHTVPDWMWTGKDFLVIGIIIYCTGLFFEFAASFGNSAAYRLGALSAIGAGFMLVWVTLAVQIIGEENPANVLYLLLILVPLLGSVLFRFKASGLSSVMFVTAVLQMSIPIIAFIVWPNDFSPGLGPVLGVNAFFSILWAFSGLLYRYDADVRHI